MTRDELIETMATAHARAFTATRGDTRLAVTAALSAIEAAGYVVVAVDDDSRDFADSNLPLPMIEAGMDALDETLHDPEIDWDYGMKAVACYRAMIAARP